MKVFSVCPYCGVGCGLEVEVEKGKIAKINPQKDHPISKGRLCIKGATLLPLTNHPERLKYPLIRKGDKFERISWDKALDIIAEELIRIRDTYGKNSIGIFSSTKCTNEENYLIQKFARVVIGTNNIDNCTRLCHASTLAGLYEILGKSAMTNSYEDLKEAECILAFGVNPAITQPIGFDRILEMKKHGGKLIVIDVRKTETAEKADIFVRVNPNTDILFVAGLMKVIIEEKLENKKFIKERTLGFEQFKRSLERFDLSHISRITGVEEKTIREVALLYAKSKKAAVLIGMGMTQHSNGVENILTIGDLVLLTGNFGKPGSGINPLRGCNNVQGACDVGALPNVYPGYSSLTQETIKKFEKIWKVKGLPISKGLTEYEMIEAIPERIIGMYIIGNNPVVSLPNSNRVEENLKNLEFLVVQDIFMTETARLANIILPAADFLEKTGTFTNSERRVQLINKATEPPGEAKEDWVIIKLLAERIGFKDEFNFNSAEEIFREMRKVIPQYSGITYKKLGRKGIQWPCDKKNPKGTQILYTKDFGYPGKRAIFYPVSFVGPQTLNHAYPYVLISHRWFEHFNTGAMTRKVDSLNKLKPDAYVEISKEDAEELKIKDGEIIKISSPFGEIEIKAKISNRVSKGVLAAPNHYSEERVNKLTSPILDPVSKIPAFKYCNVKIEKIVKN
ncbi:MAG: formate dehydrogenase subunit alpha [Candidatus Aenigmatarchaeota archaeon]